MGDLSSAPGQSPLVRLPRVRGAKTSLPWSRSESSNMWKNAFFHPSLRLVTQEPCLFLACLYVCLLVCVWDCVCVSSVWSCPSAPWSHGTDLWEQAAVRGLNWKSSVWRTDTVVWPVESHTGHCGAVPLKLHWRYTLCMHTHTHTQTMWPGPCQHSTQIRMRRRFPTVKISYNTEQHLFLMLKDLACQWSICWSAILRNITFFWDIQIWLGLGIEYWFQIWIHSKIMI